MSKLKIDRVNLKKSLEYQEIIKELSSTTGDAHRVAKLKLRQLQKQYKRKVRREKKKVKKKYVKKNLIEFFAKNLENNLPASERWFREMYLKEEFKRTFSEDLFKDQFNKPFNKRYIPDVSNIGYKYIIEVDGSIHNKPEQIIMDLRKDHYFKKRGYLVIRVKYGDNEGYRNCIEQIKERIKEIDILELSRRSKF